MVSRIEASGELVRHLSYAMAAICNHLDAGSDAHLAKLEIAIDEMLLIHRHVVMHIATDGGPESFNLDEAGRIFRLMVNFTSVLSLVVPRLKTEQNQHWGAHLFGSREFEMIAYDTFDVPTKPKAIKRLLAYQATDLIEAASAVAEQSVISAVHGLTSSIEESIDAICDKVGTVRKPRLDMVLWNAAEVSDRLDLSPAELARRTAQGKLLSVVSWSGEVQYPIFQFEGKRVKPTLEYLAENVSPHFSGWRLALWAKHHAHQNNEFFETRLSKFGLWKPAWNDDGTGDLDAVKGKAANVPGGTTLFRIVKTGNSPFYFSSSTTESTNTTTASVDGRVEPRAPAGRFDLHQSTKLGTLYLAETSRGAWREVLDREPVVTLHDIVVRTTWALTPKESHKVADVTTGTVDVSASNNRPDTQHLAQRMQPRFAGIRYRLRSTIDDFGIALFGKSGARLPDVAGIGFWNATATNSMYDRGLWEYLEKRDDDDAPVHLQRFPMDIKAIGVASTSLQVATKRSHRNWTRLRSRKPSR